MSKFIEYSRVNVIVILKNSKVVLGMWIKGEKFLLVEVRELSGL